MYKMAGLIFLAAIYKEKKIIKTPPNHPLQNEK
jgi:hypothetical protein